MNLINVCSIPGHLDTISFYHYNFESTLLSFPDTWHPGLFVLLVNWQLTDTRA